MNKKWAILITVAAMAVIYLFLLVGVPMLADMVVPCGSDNDFVETANNSSVSGATVNWTSAGPALDVRPARERYKAPLIIYLVPGLVCIFAIVVIWKQKKEVKGNE